jgi:RHS repeat-associated protein
LVQTGPGPWTWATHFDALDDAEVNLQSTANYTDQLTLEIWAQPEAGQSDSLAHIFTKNSYYASSWQDFPVRLSYSPTNGFEFALSKGNDYSWDAILSSGAVTPSQWYHVVAVYRQNGLCELWVNGAMVASQSVNFTVSSNARPWKLANATENAGGANHAAFWGMLSEAAIYSTALPAARIQAHFDAMSPNNLTRVDYPDGTAKIYHYEDPTFRSHLTGISYVEAGGATTRYATYTYDTDGKAILTEYGGGTERFDLQYNSETETVVADAVGTVEVLTFSSTLGVKNLISRVNQADLKSLNQTFDARNNLTCRKDEEDRVTTYAYNATNQRLSKTEGLTGTCASPVTTSVTRTISYQYLSPTLNLPTIITGPSVYASGSKTTTFTYGDPSHPNLPTAIAYSGYAPSGTPVNRTVAVAYNTTGQVTSIDGPRTDSTDVTTLTYYTCATGGACGQLASITNALGHVTTFDTYDAHGRVTEMTDSNGLVTTYTYDGRGRVLTVVGTPPTGSVRTTTYTYNAAGSTTSVTQPNSVVLTYTYNAAQQLSQVTDNLGNHIDYAYDVKGNRTGESTYDPSATLVRDVTLAYDIRNHVASINAAGSLTQHVHDALGNLVEEIDPNYNPATVHDVDPLNRLSETVDALSGITTYDYDVNDRLQEVTAPSNATTTYVYDDLGNVLSVTSPDTGTTTYTYDEAGNLLTQTDANSVTVEYEYDALNRPTTISYPNSALNATMTYDEGTNQKGRLTTMVDGSGTTTSSYDVFGNLAQKSKVIDGNTHLTTYTYDDADLLESIVYPSGRAVDYTRNGLGQITEVETTYDTTTLTVANSIEYEPFGPLSGLTFGNSLVMSRDYDQQYRLTDQATGPVQDLSFTLDAAGNIDAIANAVNTALSQSFTQDALHRIDYESGAYGTKDYTYGAVGNRLTRVHDNGSITTQTLTYMTASNRLATHDGNTVTIDAAGNTTADITENLSFVYDDHNRMVEAYVGAVLRATYVYNRHGQRVKKIEATGDERTLIFHYGLDGELLGETVYDDLGARIGERDYIWVDTLPIAQSERAFAGSIITASQFAHIHADQLNTPRLATNDSGAVVWRWDSDAFGVGEADLDPDLDTNEVNVRLRFPGQYFDDETGLHYNYFRDYDPDTGRYAESDPIGLAGGLNPYLYASSNPLRYTDSYGLTPLGAAIGIGVRVVGGRAAAGVIGAGARNLLGPTVGGIVACGLVFDCFPEPVRNEEGGESCPVPDTTRDRITRGNTDIRTKPGNADTASGDFDSLNPTGVTDYGNGVRTGTLPDGRTIVVRPSRDGRPTIEIQRGGRTRIEVRYGPK